MSNVKVLISGASTAGPASAHWLHRRGAEVTLVEQPSDHAAVSTR
jgi:2-polyprenyl-6-methoxyphenol hydroxylase-like FAD-dependent oxidoreductase